MYEKAREFLAGLKTTPPKAPRKKSCRDVVNELAEEILESMRLGHRLEDVIAGINEAENMNMKLKTAREYLRPYRTVKRKKSGSGTRRTTTDAPERRRSAE